MQEIINHTPPYSGSYLRKLRLKDMLDMLRGIQPIQWVISRMRFDRWQVACYPARRSHNKLISPRYLWPYQWARFVASLLTGSLTVLSMYHARPPR